MNFQLVRYHPRTYFFGFVAVLTAVVMLAVEMPLLIGRNLEWENRIHAYRWPLHLHSFLGCVALFSGPIQFFPQLRLRHLQLHRQLGKIYATSIFIAAPIGIQIALFHLKSEERLATAATGVLWLLSTVGAIHFAMKRNLIAHQIWMTRSYALTLTFVIMRLLVDVLKIRGSAELGFNGGLIWITTIAVLVFSDYISSRQLSAWSSRTKALYARRLEAARKEIIVLKRGAGIR